MSEPASDTHLPDLRAIRERLGLSQAEFATLLGFSTRTVQSCEQGWRKPSPALHKTALLLLMAEEQGADFDKVICWKETHCPPERREKCVAYHARQGHLCWFLTGTLCGGTRLHTWTDKQVRCSKCIVFKKLTGQAGQD